MLTPAQLTAEFPNLPHGARVQAVVRWALEHHEDPALPAALDEVEAASAYHARMVVEAARALGDLPRLRRLAAHPSAAVRIRAWELLPLDDATPERYLTMPLSERRRLTARLAREQRPDLTARLLKLDLSDTERARLLVGAAPDEVAAHLPDLSDLVGKVARLARSCPEQVLAELRRRIEAAAPAVRDAGWEWASPALKHLVSHDPDEVLRLLADHGPSRVIPPGLTPHLGRLLRHDPEATVALLVRAPFAGFRAGSRGRQLVRNLRRALPQVSHDVRVTFARAYAHLDQEFAAILEALPPSERAALFRDALAGIGTATRVWSDRLLSALPRQVREAEARRMAALPSQAAPMRQLELAAYLHPEEARAIAAPRRRATDAEERAAALAALVASAGRSREDQEVSRALALCDEIGREQDPVKLAVVEEISNIPVAVLARQDLAPLERLTRACLDARDTSWGTLAALQRIAWALLHHAAAACRVDERAASLLEALAKDAQYHCVPWRLQLNRAAASALLTAVEPQLVAASQRDDYTLLVLLSSALGRAGWGQPVLDRVAELGLSAPTHGNAIRAARVWLADPATRALRVGQLVERDRSFATVDVVARAICLKRQDLVEVFLGPATGRFRRGRSRWLPVLDGPFGGWLPEHVQAYGKLLSAKLVKSSTPGHERRRILLTLAKLPGATVEQIAAQLASKLVPVREGALEALAYVEEPEAALARLVAHANTDHAHIAMYAARRVVLRIAPVQAAALLAPVLRQPSRLTARKEALRLLGLLRVPESLPVIAEAGLDPRQNLDLRIAAGRALLDFLHDERAWEVLTQLARGGRDEAIALARTSPRQLAVRHRARYAKIIASARAEPEVLAHLSSWVRYVPMAAFRAPVLDDVTAVGDGAAATLASCALAGGDWSIIFEVVGELLRRSRSPEEPNAQDELDLPHARRLRVLVDELTSGSWAEARWHRENLRVVAGMLGEAPDVIELTWEVLLEAVDWVDPMPDLMGVAETLHDVSQAHQLHLEVWRALARAADENQCPGLSIEDLDELITMDGPGAAAVALAGVTQQGARLGWPESWRARLRTLRKHPIAAIAGAAVRTSTTE